MLTNLFLAPLLVVSQSGGADAAPVDQPAIDAAIDRGTAHLLALAQPPEAVRRKPKRSALANERVGMRALVLYTLAKCGADPSDPGVRHLVTSVSAEPLDQTYDVACVLLALAALDPIGHRPWIDELAGQLLEWQEENGAWGYPGLIIDLSNTQYAALGLWAAARAGVPIEAAVWEKLARGVLLYKSDAGGFQYTPGGEGSTGSMTAAGIGTLALCELHLLRADALDDDLAAQLRAARVGGLAWLDQYFSVETNPRAGAWLYYWLYGLERVGGLAGPKRVGEHDWYREGAAFLVPRQDEEGSWNGGTDLSETCFALLFLKRATSADSRPTTPAKGERKGEPVGDFTLAADGEGPLKIWIESWQPLKAGPLTWSGERGLGPRVQRVEYLADGERIGVVLGAPAEPASGGRFALDWVPDRAGTRSLVARAYVVPPEGSEAVTLESGPLEVEVTRALPAWLDAERHDLGPNLAPGFRPTARASSEPKKTEGLPALSYEADLAVDGLPRTPWLVGEGDRTQSLKLSFRKSEPVDVVRVWPALLPALGPGFLTRPLEIEVKINGRETHDIRLEEPGRPATIELGEKVKIKRIDVRIVSVEAGEHPAVGIGEVELFARK